MSTRKAQSSLIEGISMNDLLTGGAGFIGSHTAVELIAAGHGVVIADDLSNSSASVIERVNDAERGEAIKPTTRQYDQGATTF